MVATPPISKAQLYAELEDKTEDELEAVITREPAKANAARYILGKLMIEGNYPERIQHNETKGLNWLKASAQAGLIDALEYKTYYDIRFDPNPVLKKILGGLDKIVEGQENNSRACNTLAEFSHAQAKDDQATKEKAAKYYKMSADQGCLIGTHWLGVFFMEGFGVTQNLDKAEEYLTKAAKMGNMQSYYQLFLLYSKEEGKKDVVKAYKHIMKAVSYGVTFFDQLTAFFKENYDVLMPVFCEMKKPPATVDRADKSAMENLHEAYVSEMSSSFMTALGKDRMYRRPCGSVNDNQIWMLGVLVKYFLKQVMRMDHRDFTKAMKEDLGPILGDTGLWALKNYTQRQIEKGNLEKKKQARVAMDLITKYLEEGWDSLGKESKYNMLNKYGPKRCPEKQVRRAEIKFLYSWTHYAPMTWFNDQREHQKHIKLAEESKGAGVVYNLCSHCGAPEGTTVKHKRCAQCKQRLYCSVECQRNDWKKGHKHECKELAAKAAKK